MYTLNNALNSCRANIELLEDVDAELAKTMNTVVDVASELQSRTQGTSENVDDKLDELKDLMAELIKQENDTRCFKSSVNELVKQLQTSDEGIPDDFDKSLKAIHGSVPNEIKHEDHARYKELIQVISQGSDELDDDIVPQTQPDDSQELLVTQADTDNVPIDPLTKKQIEDPVRNSICKHVYERSTITAHIIRRRGCCNCPAMGCTNKRPLTQEGLEEHDDLRQLIRRNRATQNALFL